VDEAGLLGIRQMAQVFEAAERLQARVILQGDRRQHGSVERGATQFG
jgi:ATP-dependent exoDNAse (exonuclease V) alpha subunit